MSLDNWLPYTEDLPPTKKMFVVIAKNVPYPKAFSKYTTDPYCVWKEPNGRLARWPHSFPPTHYITLPE